jgi:HSP20 family protein
MTITRFAPFRSPISDVALLQNRLNSIFQDFSWPTSQGGSTESLATGSFVPAVDVYEDAQKVVVKIEVPGVKQEDLDVRLENQTLTVKGERKFDAEEKEENFHRIERRYGSFVRSFTVPQTVDTDSIAANYDAGVLTVSLNKKAEAKPKQVKIGVTSAQQAAAKPKQVEASTAA